MNSYHILVVCTAGISSSFLVRRMIAASERHGVAARIWSIGESEVPSHWQDADIIMLGPQVRFMQPRIADLVQHSIPVATITMTDFGMLDGEAVLQAALQAMAGYHFHDE